MREYFCKQIRDAPSEKVLKELLDAEARRNETLLLFLVDAVEKFAAVTGQRDRQTMEDIKWFTARIRMFKFLGKHPWILMQPK